MNIALLKKRYNIYIISFILLSAFFGHAAFATPACPIITNQFQGANGVTIDTGPTGWSVDSSLLLRPHPSGFLFAINSNRFTATNLGGVGIVTSHVFSIAGYKAPQVSVKITSESVPDTTQYIQFYYKLDGGAPVLVATQKGNFGSLTFTSPVLNGSTVQLIIKLYDFSTTSTKSNYYIERFDIFQTAGPCTPGSPTITVTPSATHSVLTCTNPSTTLSATSSTTGLAYFWTGPGITGSSAGAAVAVTVPGTYTVTATDPTNGCTATAQTTVAQTTTAPALLAITGSPSNVQLTCNTTSVSLTATSSTSGTTFIWKEPNGTTPTGATIAASDSGSYIVTATNPTTGCTAKDTVQVTKNLTAPAAPVITSSPSNVLTCTTTSVSLTGSSTTTGATYTWTGPGITGTRAGATVAVTVPGTYTVTATNPTTGCTATTSTTVTQTNTAPAGVAITTANNSTQLTCSTSSITLTGSSTSSGVSYNWTGPNGFTATGITATAAAQGQYVLTATDPTTGCTSSVSATISQNFNPPADVTAINSGPLTCSNTVVTLTGSSSTSGVTFLWTGPNNFTSSSATPTTTVPGTYTLTVTNPVNGCTAIATTVVAQNITAPGGLLINSTPTAPVLTCTNTSVSLMASSDVTGATYNWTGPNGFATSAASISVSTPGVYAVTALNTANGCSSSINVNVSQNIAVPAGLAATSLPINATLTCTVTSIALTATSAVTGASYAWTGPNSFTGSTAAITAASPGTYTVTATDPSNGCSATANAIVSQNITAPVGLKSTPDPTNSLITCTHPNVVLTASATTTTVLYSWTGANSFTATGPVATITAPGSYRLTATDTTNGCTSFVTAAVSRNITPPNGVTTSTSDVLTCLITDVFVKGTSNTTGALFSWTGPGGFTASTAIAHTSTPGTYNLTVTNPVNGCTATANTIVASNTTAPSGVAATNSGPLNCINTSVNLMGSATTTDVSFNWAAPDNSLLQGATVSVTLAGTYTLVVTDSSNGCTATATTTVTQNTTGCTGSSVQTNSSTSSKLLTAQGADSTQGTTAFEYKVYPNPFSGRAYIEFKSPASSLVTMEIYSNTGVLKKVLFNSTVIANQSYKLELNKGSLSSGVYFCIIRSNGKVYSTKLILIDP